MTSTESRESRRRRDWRAAWGAAIAGLVAFMVATLLGQSALVRIIAFALGNIGGSLAGEAPKRADFDEQVRGS